MAIEAVAAVAAKEVAVGAAKEAAMQAGREIAQKMAADVAANPSELQHAMLERQTVQEGFCVGEMPETKGEGLESLKRREADAAEDLRAKMDADAPEGDDAPEARETPMVVDAQDAPETREVSEAPELAELKSEYADDLLERSEMPETIDRDAVVSGDYEKLSPDETRAGRAEFNQSKADLISRWEEKNGRPWPRYEADVQHNGTTIRRAGDLYDCHHMQPLGFGGKNEVSNVTPLHALEHYDRQGIHAFQSPYNRLENYLKLKEVA